MLKDTNNNSISNYLDMSLVNNNIVNGPRIDDLEFSKLTLKEEFTITMDNFNGYLAEVNQQLSTYCLPRPVNLQASPGNILVLECMYKLLRHRKRENEKHEKYKGQISRLKSDYANLENSMKTVIKENDQSQREFESQKVKLLDEIDKEGRKRQSAMKDLEAIRANLKNCQQRLTMMSVEKKQLQTQLAEMKDRLAKLMNEKSLVKNGIVINNLPRSYLQNFSNLTSIANKDSIIDAEFPEILSQKDEVLQENLSLRSSLKEVNQSLDELQKLVFKKNYEDEEALNSLTDGQFELPLSIVNEELKNSFKEKIAGLQSRIAALNENEKLSNEEHRQQAEEVIQQQQEMLQFLISQKADNITAPFERLLKEHVDLLEKESMKLAKAEQSLYSLPTSIGDFAAGGNMTFEKENSSQPLSGKNIEISMGTSLLPTTMPSVIPPSSLNNSKLLI